jgi:hypothetical protein
MGKCYDHLSYVERLSIDEYAIRRPLQVQVADQLPATRVSCLAQ